MSSTRVLGTANVNSYSQERSERTSDSRTISLLAFLVAENRRLQNMVAELERDTTALREALQNT
jgi:cell shape-determining protein MreC